MTQKTTTRAQPEIQIKQQRRKSLVMRVSAAGEVIVQIPQWIRPSDPIVRRFIEDGLAKLSDQIPEKKPAPLHNAATIRAMAERWAATMGLRLGRIQCRAMTRKWGSCSNHGNITFNRSLFYLPEHLVEYVVVHELTHLVVFDHSRAYWAKLREYVPDYEAYEQELAKYRV